MLKNIIFVSQHIAEGLKPLPSWAIISITGAGPEEADTKANLKEGWLKVLRLKFDDITSYHSGYKSFSYEQAADVILFLNNLVTKTECTTLVVHCAAGISRSAAVAMFAAKHYAVEGFKLHGTQNHNTLVYKMLEYELHKVTDND